MGSELYKLKPLAWEGSDPVTVPSDDLQFSFDIEGGWRAIVPGGSYTVERRFDTGTLQWGYCFAEYYDEDTKECDSVEEGKAAAEKHWRDRILPALELVDTKPPARAGKGAKK